MDLSYFYVINELLKGIIEKGKIKLTIPEKTRSARQKYIIKNNCCISTKSFINFMQKQLIFLVKNYELLHKKTLNYY